MPCQSSFQRSARWHAAFYCSRVRFKADLSRFNIEINIPVEEIAGEGLGRMHANVSETMRRCASNANEDVAGDFFERDDDSIRLTREVVPAMLTTQERIIRQDCLCYLMEELSP